MTVKFLGNILETEIPELIPPFELGKVGVFDEVVFLPKDHPNVVAWKVHLYDSELTDWLGPFLPHVTVCRQPFNEGEWLTHFRKLPVVFNAFHLYESVGNLNYISIRSIAFEPPFIPIEHTADYAYLIRGKSENELYLNALIALAFEFPSFAPYIQPCKSIKEINQCIARADIEMGCPFKAVSYHGEVVAGKYLEWEMIVDV